MSEVASLYHQSPIDTINSLIEEIHTRCLAQVEKLLQTGVMEQILDKETIINQIQEHIRKYANDLRSFLGSDGKIFVALNSAEVFADTVIKELQTDKDRVTKIKISTYKDGKSQGNDIDDTTKNQIREQMKLQVGDKVLILEDMIDSGNTLQRLVDFFEYLGVEVRILCLFDKNDAKSKGVKDTLGGKLTKIIDIGNEFIVGYGIDYSHRLCSQLAGLYKVTSPKEFVATMTPFVGAIEKVLDVKRTIYSL